ncbi:unnamed protein product [Eruca vesicaria subsp. sativa]|uniref:Uncharacterized protein n=1 Tax=Eruca vesicaria subsp. sativa TaxID=29727 RepID=A0ABC8JBA4_ERUVS|nr:unnamed protein product [Eruca vesicaria subsp. sativa]
MREIEHLKTSRTIRWSSGAARRTIYKHSDLNAPRHGMVIFEKLTGTITNPDSSSDRIYLDVGFGGAASKLGYQSPKARLGMRDIALSSHGKKEYEV